MHATWIGRLALSITLLAPVPALAQSAYQDVISREFTVWADNAVQMVDVIGREFTLAVIAPDQGPFDAISREFTLLARTPDLAVTAIDAPLGGINGTELPFAWTIANDGPAALDGSFVDRVYRSNDDQVGGDTQLGVFPFSGTIAAGESVDRNHVFAWDFEPGTYWFIVKTDADADVVEEPSEDNNALVFGPVTVADPPSPNLVVTAIEPPSDGALSGTSPTVSFTVANVGETPTQVSSWTDRVYLLTDGSGSATAGTLEASVPNPSYLQPGESYSSEVAISLPPDQPGQYWIGLKADALGAVDEGNEDDNTLIAGPFDVELEPQPDLVASAIVGPTAAFSGTHVTVSWRIDNAGDGPTNTGQWTDVVYLSDDDQPAISPGDIVLKAAPRGGLPLLPGDGEDRQVTAFLQPEWFGQKHFKVWTDSSQSVSEFGFEGNNVAVSVTAVDISLSLPPDLQPVEITASGPLLAGHEFDAHWEVENLGASQGQFTLSWKDRVYLSTDEVLDGSDVLLEQYGQGATPIEGTWFGLDYERDRTLRVPNATAEGPWHLILSTDYHDDVFEHLAEDNNVIASLPIQVNRVATNLVIEVDFDAAHQLPASGFIGETVTLSFRVTNSGAAVTPVGVWKDRIYLSSDDQPGGDSLLLTRTRNGALDAGLSYVVEAEVPLPFVAGDDYHLIFRTDTGNAVYEDGGEDDNFVASPLEILDEAPDLAALSITCDDQLTSGESASLAWTVVNQGTLATSSNVWTDRVYLSSDDVLDGSDYPLAARTHVGALAPGASYTTATTAEVPLQLSGLLYLIVVADAAHQTYDPDRSNNLKVSRTLVNVDLADASNLVAESVVAAASVLSGQKLDLSYLVRNVGAAPTNVSHWIDKVWLSLDSVLDPSADVYLGFYSHSDFLDVGEERAVALQLDVPLGVSGPYFAIVRTDAADHVWEDSAEIDNDAISPGLTEIELPPVTDLAVDAVLDSGPVLRGAEATFDWVLRNDGDDVLTGAWTDSVYLSTDPIWDASDRLFGHFTTPYVSLVPGDTLAMSGTANVPAVTPGDYYVLVRTDVFNQIPETNPDNNLGVSAMTVPVTATPLALGAPFMGPLVAGQDAYFALDVGPGETVRITLDHSSPIAWTELFVRYGAAPTPGQFDFAFDAPGLPDQEITIPTTNAGTYYVLARATYGTAGVTHQSMSLLAESLPFEIHEVQPPAVGAGTVTLRLEGALFQPDMAVQLSRNDLGLDIPALEIVALDAATGRARFDLSGAPLGTYDLIAIRSDATIATLPQAVVVEAPAPFAVQADFGGGPAIRQGTSRLDVVRVTNAGNVDVPFASVVFGTIQNDDVAIEAIGYESLSAASNGSAQAMALVVPELGPGESEDIVVRITVEGGYEYQRLGLFAYAQPWSASSFWLDVMQPLLESVRLSILADPSMSGHPADFAANQPLFWATVEDVWNQYGLNPPDPVDGPPAPSLGPKGEALCRVAYGVAATGCCVAASVAGQPWWCVACAGIGGVGIESCGDLCLIPGLLGVPGCDDDDDDDPGDGCSVVYCFGQGCDLECVDTPAPVDPNDKLGPAGFGASRFVPLDEMPYRIRFENVATATASAVRVQIVDELDVSLDPASLRLGQISIGPIVIDDAVGLMSYDGVIDLTDSLGVLAEVVAGVSVSPSGQAQVVWSLRALDPATGLPTTDPDLGLLPPNDSEGDGEGYVDLVIRPKDVPTGTPILNRAMIIFDQNAPIETNTVLNSIDADAPDSAVESLPSAQIDPTIDLSWSGLDPADGSGLAGFELYVSVDGSTFVPVEQTAGTTGAYVGEVGHTYAFYTRAVDNAGNVEPAPAEPDAVVTISSDCNGNGIPDVTEIADGLDADCDGNGVLDSCDLASGGASDANGNRVPDACECLVASYCVGAPSSSGDGALIGSSGIPSISVGDFTLTVDGAVPDQNGIFFYGPGQGSTPFGDGLLCVAGQIVRLTDPITADGSGHAEHLVDFGNLPDAGEIDPGSTWYFQYWYRDPFAGGSGFNLSDALAVTFCQ